MRLTLVLPELIWPEPEDKAALDRLPCPALEWLLARGAFDRAPARPYEAALAALFGLAGDAPFGALRLLGESLDVAGPNGREGCWLCADPVHLRFHHERIVLADAGAFELEADEAHALAGGLNREFAGIGEFHVADARRWYVRLHAGSDYAAPPLSAVAGRRIGGELPEQAGTAKLRSWLNEVQMYLHAHPVNAERERAGKPAVNSLWLWGAGALPPLADPDHDGVWAADPLARGLARAGGIPVHPAPERLAALLAHADPKSAQLVVLADLLPAVMYEDSAGWREALLRLEESWFAPLRKALGRGVDRLDLVAPTVYGQLAWQLSGFRRWQFWRRPRPLAALAGELAA